MVAMSMLNLNKSFDLVIGRKRRRIRQPAQLEVEVYAESFSLTNIGPEVTVPISQTYKLYIAEKLYATVVMYSHRKYLHAPITIIKHKRSGRLEIRLVKKYTKLHTATKT